MNAKNLTLLKTALITSMNLKAILKLPQKCHNASFLPSGETRDLPFIHNTTSLSPQKFKKSFTSRANKQPKQTSIPSLRHGFVITQKEQKFQHAPKMPRQKVPSSRLAFEAVSVLCVWCGETQMGVNRFQISKPNLTHNYMA